MWSTSLLLLLPDPLWSQIELFSLLLEIIISYLKPYSCVQVISIKTSFMVICKTFSSKQKEIYTHTHTHIYIFKKKTKPVTLGL